MYKLLIILTIIIMIIKEIKNMINLDLNFKEMSTFLFGAEEAAKMEERSKRRAAADLRA